MPALSPTMEKGNLASWKKKVGDSVKVGEEMAEVETDKATVAFESADDGYLAKILVQDGSSDVVVGTPVAILAENKVDVDKFKDYTGEGGGAAKTEEKSDAAGEKRESVDKPQKLSGKETKVDSPDDDATDSQVQTSSGQRVIASPAAKRIAKEKDVDISSIKGTGPNNRIVAADVNEFVEAGGKSKLKSAAAPAPSAAPSKPAAPTPAASGEYIDTPHTNVRKVIAQRLLQSKTTIPHYYLTMECNVDKLLKLRADLNSKVNDKDGGVKLSVNDLIVKAAALACRKVPQANSSWMDNAIRTYQYVDMSIAVSTDNGLITPVVKDADIKGLAAISIETKNLAALARSNKLKPEQFQGGTFTISNLGQEYERMYGITNFAAIINPPQACILAVGGTSSKLVEGPSKGEYVNSQVMSVTLSSDHRVVDGAVGAQWLQAFKGFVENPMSMLL